MKKIKNIILTLVVIIAVLASSIAAYAINTDAWYVYKGNSTWYSFSLNFPTDWRAITIGDKRQGFSPINNYDELLFEIQEFEGQTYEQVTNYFINENTSFVESSDFVLTTNTSDVIAKKVTYNDIVTSQNFSITLIKRGSLILSLTNSNDGSYSDIIDAIHDSFSFDDQWHQYVNYDEGYTFAFPTKFRVENTTNSVSIFDTNGGGAFFEIQKFENKSIMEAFDLVKTTNDRLETKEDIFFHDISNVISAVYLNVATGKRISYIFIGQHSKSYVASNTNVDTNYPHSDYYDQYIIEMLEGIEFFDIEGDYYSYLNFPDVRSNHQNVAAIDYLSSQGTISGYPDGTFRPDGEINRAELTKMVIEAVTNVDKNKYNNCFPDVEDQWFAPYICYAKDKNWVEGYDDDTFKPENNVNRAEAMKIVLEVMLGSSNISLSESLKDTNVTDINTEDWYYKYFVFASNRAILDMQHITESLEESYEYKPGDNMTRKEVAEMIYQVENL